MMGLSLTSGQGVPPVPDAAVALGFTKCTFYSPFTRSSEIDTSNTGAAGFNFYTRRAWASCPDTSANAWNAGPPTASNTFSIANSVLSFSDFTSGAAPGYNLGTACPVGSSYVGNVFAGRYYVRVRMKIDPSTAFSSAVSWPILFGVSVEFLTGNPSFTENDMIEFSPLGTGNPGGDATLHDWTASGASITRHNIATNGSITPYFTVDGNWHMYDCAVIASQLNGGTGIRQIYIDGVHISQLDVSWTPGGASSPGASPSNPNGTFSSLDTQNHMLIIGSGNGGYVAQFDDVTVWQ